MKFPVLFLLLFFYFEALSQFSDSIHRHINYSSSGNYNRTNYNRSFLLNNSLNLGFKKKDISWNLHNKWLYGKQQSSLVSNDYSGSLDINLYKSLPHFNYWGLLIYNRSYSLKINNQFQSGAGMAYSIIDKPYFILNLSDGILYDYNDVYLIDGAREIYETPRNSARLQVKSNLKKILAFSSAFYIQHSLEYGNDIIYKADIDLSLKIVKWLRVTARLNYNKMTRTERENLFMTYGLTFDKYY